MFMTMADFNTKKLDEFILSQIEKQNIPGLSITVTDNGKVLFEKAYGHIDKDKSVPCNNDTIMGVASLSKSFTCTCIALLEHEGKLSIDDPVSKYFPSFKIPGTPKDAVLIHHLMNHTTGIPPLPLLSFSFAGHTVKDPEEEKPSFEITTKVDTVDDIINYINNGDYKSLGQPGEYMSYSNDCYGILSSIIDKTSGMSCEQYMDEKIFKPLGMSRSMLGFSGLKNFDNVTSLFVSGKDDKSWASDNWHLAPPYRGCGWIASTSKDMNRYYSMLSQGGVIDGKRVLPEEVANVLLGPAFPLLRYGIYCYGLSKSVRNGKTLFTHTGGLKGVSSAGGFFAGTGISGSVLTNAGGKNAMKVLLGAFNIYQGLEPELPTHNVRPCGHGPSEPNIYVGKYGSAEGGKAIDSDPLDVVLNDASELIVKSSGDGPEMALHYCFENTFLMAEKGKDLLLDGMVCKFFVHGDKAWAAQAGSRMHQRV